MIEAVAVFFGLLLSGATGCCVGLRLGRRDCRNLASMFLKLLKAGMVERAEKLARDVLAEG